MKDQPISPSAPQPLSPVPLTQLLSSAAPQPLSPSSPSPWKLLTVTVTRAPAPCCTPCNAEAVSLPSSPYTG